MALTGYLDRTTRCVQSVGPLRAPLHDVPSADFVGLVGPLVSSALQTSLEHHRQRTLRLGKFLPFVLVGNNRRIGQHVRQWLVDELLERAGNVTCSAVQYSLERGNVEKNDVCVCEGYKIDHNGPS